ncbi:SDR family NAD(P)-dependent oxidoreductase [Vibrio sp. WXL103]|uniref:SDR family NAD(P)-dependent oxidoreductase n=1 Tax=Vibrio sp. WXL103 TaxID=3450710 RepID=UPI003EC593F9
MKQVIVITGSTGGVGQLIARGLGSKNRHIICVGRNESLLINQVNELASTSSPDAKFSYRVTDMMDAAHVEDVARSIFTEFGQIDMWINNVGVNNTKAMGPTWEVEHSEWLKEVELNLFTAFAGTAAAIKVMKDQPKGYVVNLGGGGADTPKPFGSAYGASKAAVVKFSETVNQELVEQGSNIRAFCFNPGFIRNTRTEALVKSDIAQKYMPILAEVMNSDRMSSIDDSLFVLESICSGDIDELAGGYLFADTFKHNLDSGLDKQSYYLRCNNSAQ